MTFDIILRGSGIRKSSTLESGVSSDAFIQLGRRENSPVYAVSPRVLLF